MLSVGAMVVKGPPAAARHVQSSWPLSLLDLWMTLRMTLCITAH